MTSPLGSGTGSLPCPTHVHAVYKHLDDWVHQATLESFNDSRAHINPLKPCNDLTHAHVCGVKARHPA